MLGFIFERSVWKQNSVRSLCWIINWKERSARRLCFFVLHWFMRKFLVAFDKREKFWDLVINVFWTVLQISAIYRQHRDISRCSNLGDIIVKNRSIYSSDFLHKKITIFKKNRKSMGGNIVCLPGWFLSARFWHFSSFHRRYLFSSGLVWRRARVKC